MGDPLEGDSAERPPLLLPTAPLLKLPPLRLLLILLLSLRMLELRLSTLHLSLRRPKLLPPTASGARPLVLAGSAGLLRCKQERVVVRESSLSAVQRSAC